jgi:co-chaperonin GroES (HSP10)
MSSNIAKLTKTKEYEAIELGAHKSKVEYKDIPKLDDCDPGIIPHEFKVLVAIPQPKKEVKFAGGGTLHLPDSVSEANSDQSQAVRIVALSAAAFTYEDIPLSSQPQIGQIGVIARYAGMPIKGRDGVHYRLVMDKDIVAILEEDSND